MRTEGAAVGTPGKSGSGRTADGRKRQVHGSFGSEHGGSLPLGIGVSRRGTGKGRARAGALCPTPQEREGSGGEEKHQDA